ncbi:MAG: DMT family transporter [Alphaproteobacteria bacterium]
MTASPAIEMNPSNRRLGMALVLGSALTWSFGGALARFITVPDPWTMIMWRSGFAAIFLIGVMLWRSGPEGALRNIIRMGLPGLGVALCFATASTSFVVGLQYTSVANILLVQAGGPLIAASLAYLLFRERVSRGTWIAIASVILGIAVMESESLDGAMSPIGGALAVLISLSFALATVITRHYSHVEMIPAVTLGVIIAGVNAFFHAGDMSVTLMDGFVLFLFGAVNLGGGLAIFIAGARLIPASIASLIGTAEPVLGPVWVWLIHGEVPSLRTIIGGAIVMGALIAHSLGQLMTRER